MPTPAFCKIEGESQGLITEGTLTEESVGNVWVKEHEDEILVQSFSQDVTAPRNYGSGKMTGQRTNAPVKFTKMIDKSSPALHQALANNELLTRVEFRFYRTDKTGMQEHYFTILLEDAYVASIRDYLPDCLDRNNAPYTFMEEVAITFRAITWEHVPASTMATDSWRDPDL